MAFGLRVPWPPLTTYGSVKMQASVWQLQISVPTLCLIMLCFCKACLCFCGYLICENGTVLYVCASCMPGKANSVLKMVTNLSKW